MLLPSSRIRINVFVPILALWILFLSQSANAQATYGGDSVDYSPWLARGEKILERLSRERQIVTKLVVITAVGDTNGVHSGKIQAEVFDRIGILRLIDVTELTFTSLFNRMGGAQRIQFNSAGSSVSDSPTEFEEKDEKGAKRIQLPSSVKKSIDYAFGVSGADLLVYAPRSSTKSWSLFYDDGTAVQNIGLSSKKISATKKRSSSRKRTKKGVLYNWVVEQIGYNGIILDQKGDYFLVAGASKFLHKGAQAVVLAGSSKKAILKRGERKGAALMTCIQSFKTFAVLRVSFKKPGLPTPKIGDKISLSK